MNGFEERDGALPTPPVEIAEETRARLSQVVAAIVTGATPEEIVSYLEDGFPAEVDQLLARPLEAEEMGAHVDLLLTTMQTPALAAA